MSICPPGTPAPALPTYASTSPEAGAMTTAAPSVTWSLPSCAIWELTDRCVNCWSDESRADGIRNPAVNASRCHVLHTLDTTRAVKNGTRFTLHGFGVA